MHESTTTRATWRWSRLSALAGGLVWLIAVAVLAPTPWETMWARLLLMLAPLVLLPLALETLPTSRDRPWGRDIVVLLLLPAALLLGWANLLEAGLTAGLLALPWLGFTGVLALDAALRFISRTPRPLAAGTSSLAGLCREASLLFLAVGAGWAVLDRFGMRPLEFEAVIVLLTAIHFHYAGFVLTLYVGLLLRETDTWPGRLAAAGVLLGVPLVAVGITSTQLGGPPWLESLAACALAGAGVLAAAAAWRSAWRPDLLPAARGLRILAALSLGFAMVLAASYGVRFFVALDWLDIPWMRALHGTANALGFALPAILSCSFEPRGGFR